jgi:flagellar motor component MotA
MREDGLQLAPHIVELLCVLLAFFMEVGQVSITVHPPIVVVISHGRVHAGLECQ